MKNPVVRKLVWILIFAVLLYTAFAIWADLEKNLATLRAFPWTMLPLILACVLVNFTVRELKWDYYRRAGGIEAPRLGSFLVFFSGYSMAISPGRVGELIKPFMYKEYFGSKMRRTIPLVFCERLSDLLGMIVLAAITVVPYVHSVGKRGGVIDATVHYIYGFLIFSALFMIALVWLIRNKRWMYAVLIQASLWARGRRRIQSALLKVRKLYYATYPLLTARNLAVTTGLAAFSWFFECIAVKLILNGVGAPQVTLYEATFIFCMATIFGGFLFFLPGGIGGFETMMALMLILLGVAKSQGVPAVFITRASTLFFGVTLGFLFILITSAVYHKRMEWEQFEHAEEIKD